MSEETRDLCFKERINAVERFKDFIEFLGQELPSEVEAKMDVPSKNEFETFRKFRIDFIKFVEKWNVNREDSHFLDPMLEVLVDVMRVTMAGPTHTHNLSMLTSKYLLEIMMQKIEEKIEKKVTGKVKNTTDETNLLDENGNKIKFSDLEKLYGDVTKKCH